MKYLKIIRRITSFLLDEIINYYLNSGGFPEFLKSSNRSGVVNYRMIKVLPFSSKIYGKSCIRSTLSTFNTRTEENLTLLYRQRGSK